MIRRVLFACCLIGFCLGTIVGCVNEPAGDNALSGTTDQASPSTTTAQ